LNNLLHAHGLEETHAVERVPLGVERQRGIVLRAVRLVVVSRIFFLKMTRILQHDRAQINGCRRGVDRAIESLLHETRDVAAMIEMRMSEDDGFDLVGRNGRGLPVALTPLFLSLEQTTVDEDLHARAGGVAGDVQ